MEQPTEWSEMSAAVGRALVAWREVHPTATLAEIERVVDEQLATLRAQLIQDVALASAQTDVRHQATRLACPACGCAVRAEGQRPRTLRTDHERRVVLTRSYVICPRCGAGFFPPG